MKNPIILFLAMFVLTTCSLAAFGQTATSVSHNVAVPGEKDISMLRMDLRSEKKKIIALNVPFTDVEATKFWPVYDQYVGEMTKNHDAFYALIRQYAENQLTMTDAQAVTLLDQWSKLQVEDAKTRQKYIPLVEKVISPRKAAIFFQVDRRLYLLMDLQVTANLPLITQ